MIDSKYANYYGYSDVSPYEITKVVSDITLEIRQMEATLDPTFKCETVVGGFFGHTTNNDKQSYSYKSIESAPSMRIRYSKAKKGWFSSCGQRHILEDQPVRFYDYNF
tara:strand:+ start:1798 stop:2121 length:324 start_codon:yes stop_codon:yes gene_type:complete